MLKHLIAVSLFVVAMIAHSAYAADAAPGFSLPTSGGGKVSLKSLKGKVVYVDFWATWCPPCRKSFPWMNEMHDRYHGKGLEIVAISLDKAQKPVTQFLETTSPRFTVALDPEATMADRYGVKVMPTSYLIDRKGKVRMTHRGFRNRDKQALEEEIRKLLAE